MSFLIFIAAFAHSLCKSRRQLTLENLALRQQLAMLKHSVKRPRVSPVDRLFWILFSRYVDGWRAMLHALHPDTVVRWHRQGFGFYWRWKSRGPKPGRPAIDAGLRKLIREMQATNMGWGAPATARLLPRASNLWGTAKVGYSGLSSHSFEVYGASAKTTFADLADVSRKPC
jgi:hypothetical protein